MGLLSNCFWLGSVNVNSKQPLIIGWVCVGLLAVIAILQIVQTFHRTPKPAELSMDEVMDIYRGVVGIDQEADAKRAVKP